MSVADKHTRNIPNASDDIKYFYSPVRAFIFKPGNDCFSTKLHQRRRKFFPSAFSFFFSRSYKLFRAGAASKMSKLWKYRDLETPKTSKIAMCG